MPGQLAYKFDMLCGTVHKCGNVVFAPSTPGAGAAAASARRPGHNDTLLSAVGNRVSAFDLVDHATKTLPFESRKNIACMALDPEGRLLLVVDVDGRALCVDYPRRTVLYRFNFKRPARDVKFSRDGLFFAVTHDTHVQVWRSPGRDRTFSPFVLHRVYTGHYDDVACIDWRSDSRYFMTGSRDMTARIYSLFPEKKKGFVPVTFAGHRDTVLGAFWGEGGTTAYTVSRDAAVFEWSFAKRSSSSSSSSSSSASSAADTAATGVALALATEEEATEADLHRHSGKADTRFSTMPDDPHEDEFDFMMRKVAAAAARRGAAAREPALGGGKWSLDKKHFIQMDHAKVACAAFQRASSLLVVGLDSGVFGIYDMPGFVNIHTLSISQHAINTVSINDTGEWLAFGSAALGQLLVWEWRSETYVLKQQGHFYDLNVIAYSPDGRLIATGGDDAKVKLWNSLTGFCFVTFSDHEAPVTAVEFACGETGNAVISASLDGTVRAFDLARYKNFRTMRTPEGHAAQLLCLAVDGSGEVICAGAMEPYEIYVWSLRNGQLLDVLTGHEGPVCSLAFSPTEPILASASWDKTVGLWEPYKSTVPNERFKHKSDALAVAFRPDGRQVCAATLDGQLTFWNVKQGKQDGYIQGRRDITGGRRQSDMRSATASAQGKCFTSVTYTADGSCVLAGGRSKFVCIYQVGQRVLLKKFQLSHNRSMDGVLNFLNSADMTEAGPAHTLGDADSDSDDPDAGRRDPSLPGAKRGNLGTGKRNAVPEIRSKAVRFSPTGRSWAAATTEGLVVYSLRDDAAFAPFELTEEITPAVVERLVRKGVYGKALLVALHLSEADVLRRTVLAVPVSQIAMIAKAVPRMFVHPMLECIASILLATPHLEFALQWCLALFRVHGPAIRRSTGVYMRSLRSLQKAVSVQQKQLTKMGDGTKYLLEYLTLKRPGEERDDSGGAEGGAAVSTGNKQGKRRRVTATAVSHSS